MDGNSNLDHVLDDMEPTLADRLGFAVVVLLIVLPFGLALLTMKKLRRVFLEEK